MEITKRRFLFYFVDCFFRFRFSFILNKKNPENNRVFKKKQKKKTNKLKANVEKKFNNKKVKNRCTGNGIGLKHSIPLLHESKGRIQRLNRKIRNLFRKIRRQVTTFLVKAFDSYNNVYHRGIAMKPIEALDSRNWEKIVLMKKNINWNYKNNKLKKSERDFLEDVTNKLLRIRQNVT